MVAAKRLWMRSEHCVGSSSRTERICKKPSASSLRRQSADSCMPQIFPILTLSSGPAVRFDFPDSCCGSALPQQESGKSNLTAGPDDKVRIGKIWGIQESADCLRSDEADGFLQILSVRELLPTQCSDRIHNLFAA